MMRIRNERTSRQRPLAGATLVLAAASGGLLAAALAGSPTAHADNPYADILNDTQTVVALGESEYSSALTDFSTAGGTNDGLIAAFTSFDNIFVSPTDYTLLGLTAAATNTDFSGYGTDYNIPLGDLTAATAAGETAIAATDANDATVYFADATTAFSSGEYFGAAFDDVTGSYFGLLSSQADTLAALFSAGI